MSKEHLSWRFSRYRVIKPRWYSRAAIVSSVPISKNDGSDVFARHWARPLLYGIRSLSWRVRHGVGDRNAGVRSRGRKLGGTQTHYYDYYSRSWIARDRDLLALSCSRPLSPSLPLARSFHSLIRYYSTIQYSLHSYDAFVIENTSNCIYIY